MKILQCVPEGNRSFHQDIDTTFFLNIGEDILMDLHI